jgi:hypothetical protein
MKLAVAVYETLNPARDAIDELEELGVPRRRINLLAGPMAGIQSQLQGTDVRLEIRTVEGVGQILVGGPFLEGVSPGGPDVTLSALEARLVASGVSEPDASVYLGYVRRGHVVLLVDVEEDLLDRAEAILEHNKPEQTPLDEIAS